jgi:hypothetical protein
MLNLYLYKNIFLLQGGLSYGLLGDQCTLICHVYIHSGLPLAYHLVDLAGNHVQGAVLVGIGQSKYSKTPSFGPYQPIISGIQGLLT